MSPNDHVGRTRTSRDAVTATAVGRLAATFGWEAPSALLPPLWHWLFTAQTVPIEDLGPDGHERLGIFLPEIPGALRMWAGSRVEFVHPIRIGDDVETRSTITNIAQKSKAGEALWFVDLLHEVATPAGLAIRDTQTIVYRVSSQPRRPRDVAPSPPASVRAPRLKASFGDTQLFRYSALTFNSHRIHLDRAFCEAELGTPRLVVHGPLLATLAAQVARDVLQRDLSAFSFRARNPVFEDEEVHVAATKRDDGTCFVELLGADGATRLEADAAA